MNFKILGNRANIETLPSVRLAIETNLSLLIWLSHFRESLSLSTIPSLMQSRHCMNLAVVSRYTNQSKYTINATLPLSVILFCLARMKLFSSLWRRKLWWCAGVADPIQPIITKENH